MTGMPLPIREALDYAVQIAATACSEVVEPVGSPSMRIQGVVYEAPAVAAQSRSARNARATADVRDVTPANARPHANGGVYVNFSGLGEEAGELRSAVFGASEARLAAVRASHDSDGVFSAAAQRP
ncbi:hypothetical protein BH23GEM9_BH23GEM9_08990 [soil metagenome]